MEKSKEKLKDRIASLRDKSGLNQDEFAAAAGLSFRGFQGIEQGKVDNPGIATIAKIAETYNVSLDFLYYGKQTSMSKSDLIVDTVALLPSLDEKKLRLALSFIEKLSRASGSAVPTKKDAI